jgi:uncharacterized protein (TIGR02996 family)
VSLWDRVRSWWQGPEPELEPLLLPSLRHPELEAQIREDPTALEPYLVYADWLQEHGERWGELIAVQVALEQHPSSAQKLREHELLQELPFLRRLRPFHPAWWRGFVVGLQVPQHPDAQALLDEARRAEPFILHFLQQDVPTEGDLEGTLQVDLHEGQVGVSLRARLPPEALAWLSLTRLSERLRLPYGGDVTTSPDTLQGQTPLSFVFWVDPWPGRRRVHFLVRLRLDTASLEPHLYYEASAEIEASALSRPLALCRTSPRDLVRTPSFSESRGERQALPPLPERYPVPAEHPRLPELRWRHQGAGPPSYHPLAGRAARLVSIDTLSEHGISLLMWRDEDGRHGWFLLPDAGQLQRPLSGHTWVLDDGTMLALVNHTWWLDYPLELIRLAGARPR